MSMARDANGQVRNDKQATKALGPGRRFPYRHSSSCVEQPRRSEVEESANTRFAEKSVVSGGAPAMNVRLDEARARKIPRQAPMQLPG